MKKFLKSFLVIMLTICVAMPLVACKKKVSKTTTDESNVKTVAGVNTNGGMTVVYGDYLYFVNGIKDNDGTSQSKNKRSAICRVKYNTETGETSGDIEIVVDELVGFKYGSLYFFGDYMYYATPCASKNNKAEVLYNKTCFKRYDLVNKKSYTLYTTQLNSEDEEVDYAYYVVDNTLNLLVYESDSYTLKSFKIDKKVKENYTISDVSNCFFSENKGIATNGSVDANSFVYYTVEHGLYEGTNEGVNVYKVSPIDKTKKVLLSSEHDIEFISIRAGKLVYSSDEKVFACSITSKTDEKLAFDNEHCISYKIPTNAIYIENYKLEKTGSDAKLVKSEGDIAVLLFDKDTGYLCINHWSISEKGPEFTPVTLKPITDKISDYDFVGTAILEETEEVENDTTTDAGSGDEGGENATEPAEGTGESESEGTESGEANETTKTEITKTYLYVVYRNSDTLYKLKIAEVNEDGSMDVIRLSDDSVQVSGSTLADNVGKLTPEIIGNYLFIYAENSDKVDYMIKVDLTKENKKASTYISLEEAVEKSDEDDD